LIVDLAAELDLFAIDLGCEPLFEISPLTPWHLDAMRSGIPAALAMRMATSGPFSADNRPKNANPIS
jgi:hypothetical protein